jgi:hypothetical protein
VALQMEMIKQMVGDRALNPKFTATWKVKGIWRKWNHTKVTQWREYWKQNYDKRTLIYICTCLCKNKCRTYIYMLHNISVSNFGCYFNVSYTTYQIPSWVHMFHILYSNLISI